MRVFVSSTSLDLSEERGVLANALHQLSTSQFNGMEHFGSRPETPKEVCLKEVAASNVYVGIFAERYGYVDPDTGLSMTELEYRQARECNLPCLIYIKANAALETDITETDRNKLTALKAELKRMHVVSSFTTADNLATKVVIDLYNLLKNGKLPSANREFAVTDLLPILSARFDLEELRTLCFELGVDFDDLRGEGKSAKARELILRMQRRQQVEKLIKKIRDMRPDIDWT
jgi:predicted transcriptional regulator